MKQSIFYTRLFLISINILLFTPRCFSQHADSSLIASIEKIKISGYVDAYYARYSDSVGTNNYQKFPDISPKSNVFGINSVQLTAQYTGEKIRAVTTFHYGDMPSSAWSPVFNLIQEANAGVRLTKKIWLDAGFFKTHIGTEALLPKDNIASSLAIITFYEPWWQAGLKVTYTPNSTWLVCLHVLNGYNTFVDNNKSKSYGLSLSRTLGDKGSLGYYNLIGDETPENIKGTHLRMLHNLVFNYQLTPKFKTILGVDYITQKHSKITDSTKTASVYSAILTLRYQLKPKFAVYARGETFSDKDGFLTGQFVDNVNKITGFIVSGVTAGLEYKPTDNSFIRLEGRELMMNSNQQIFRTNGANTNNRTEVMINLGIWF